jgi:hypothetical protein
MHGTEGNTIEGLYYFYDLYGIYPDAHKALWKSSKKF